MKEIQVGIIGAANERHSLYLAEQIERQGAEPIILDNSPDKPFPLSLHEEQSEYDNRDLANVYVYFLRALFLPSPAFDASDMVEDIKDDGYVAYAAARERYATWLSWLMSAPYHGRQIVNPVETLMIHFAKPYHLEVLRANGIPVPETLVTSNVEKLLAFSQERELIYKPVAGGALCRMLTEEDKEPERLAALANAPVQFQQYIEGNDLRVFVLDGQVIASFLVEGEGVDYREGTNSVQPYEITPEIASLCIQACASLGLIFSGVDLKLRPDGSVVCIECNPSPMFEGFDRVAPQSIVSQIATYLIEKTIEMKQKSLKV